MNALQQNRKFKVASKLYPAVREALIIVIITVIVAIAFNALRPSGIPLFGFSSSELIKKQQANIPLITIAEAHDMYLKKKVVFVDARDPLSFEEGHIAGAINIYPDEVAIHLTRLKSLLSENAIVVTYCDGPQCPLSKETAHALLSQGIPKAQVFINGWSLWLHAGYPVARGKI